MGSLGFHTPHIPKPKIPKMSQRYMMKNARVYEGIVPKEAKFDPHTKNDIQMRVNVGKSKSIIFQFKLTREDKLSITAYDPETKNRVKTRIDSRNPSINDAIRFSKTTRDRNDAIQMKQMFNKTSGISETSLHVIVYELKKRNPNRRNT